MAKEWRDQQITELLSLGPNRNQSQEEQLRALRLEKEFERRAQEEEDDDEEDHVRTNASLKKKSVQGVSKLFLYRVSKKS